MHGHNHKQDHSHSHEHNHGHDYDWGALGDHLEREAELSVPAITRAAHWLRELLSTDGGPAGVGRVLDVGSGPGVVTGLLADTFPDAEVVAVDQAPALLARAQARSAGRITTHRADLPGDFGTLGTADLIWSANAVHHLGDQQAALTALAASLRPGGLLAIAERGLPPRFLPRDIGLGRPGLQARLDAAWEGGFADMRADLPDATEEVEDWPAMLTRAGLTLSGTRTFLTDWPAPLAPLAREHLQAHVTRLRDRFGEYLDAGDRAALEALVDTDAPTGLLHRPDVFFLTATTVFTARASS
ncbi:methyltransferase domain-containing protein [Kitasatospora sp. NPDC088548]|uniref:methyltransferase domain-containing protein n=1 Tax=Kitasatospora sp. NPDC088548 TaxID=3364075 RepID=UPI0037F6305D